MTKFFLRIRTHSSRLTGRRPVLRGPEIGNEREMRYKSAVTDDVGSGDESGVIASKKGHQRRNVARLTHSACHLVARNYLDPGRSLVFLHVVRHHRSGRDGD